MEFNSGFKGLKNKRKERRWWERQLYTSREVYSGSSLLADLNFQLVSGLYKNFTRMSPSEFELLINLIGEKISHKDTAFRKAISVQERLALTVRFDKFYFTSHSPLHFTITKKLNKPHNTTDSHHSSRRKHQEWKGGQKSGRWWRVTLHVHTCSSLHHIIPFNATARYRQHTEQARNVTA
jgi:phosphoribosyl-AMP cyclohydrolase